MIYFYNTYLSIGGAENLIYSILKRGSLLGDRFGLIGIDEGYLYLRLREENIDFEFIKHNEIARANNFKKDDILILFGNFYGIESFKSFQGRVAVWAILYSSLVNWNRFVIEKRIFGRNVIAPLFTKMLIKKLLRSGSLYAMDGSVKNEIQLLLKRNYPIPLMPIPISNLPCDNLYKKRIHKKRDCLNITYIGRGDDIWKIKPLKKILSDISTLNFNINVHVFTNDKQKFESELRDFDHLKISYYIGIYGSGLNEKLLEISDINFSMGTSALESAKLGIPTILMDASYFDFPSNYKYKWLFSTTDLSLGSFLKRDQEFEGLQLNEVLGIFSDTTTVKLISEKCYLYIKQYHAIEPIYNYIVQIQPKTKIKDILKLTPASWRKSLFHG